MPTAVPKNPKIYHITHVGNLPEIVTAGLLWSDRQRVQLHLDCRLVGMSQIKQRRLYELPVSCHPGTMVGDYVPFYFCPRSIMLYILHKANHQDLAYREGQRSIVHLQADLRAVVDRAGLARRRWAYSDRNAGTRYANFFDDIGQLGRVDWEAVNSPDFRDSRIKDGKQAEFLVHDSFPWELVEKIGVIDEGIAQEVGTALSGSIHKPAVEVEPGWYY